MLSQVIAKGSYASMEWVAYERISNSSDTNNVASTWSLMNVVLDIPSDVSSKVAWVPEGRWVFIVGYENTTDDTSIGCEVIGKLVDGKYVSITKALNIPLRTLCPIIYWDLVRIMEKRQREAHALVEFQ
jgi:hypothetical protein